jgi:RNA polymerase sigma factor (sigma-70 family)
VKIEGMRVVVRNSAGKFPMGIGSLWSVGAVGLKSDRDLLEIYIQGGDQAELAFGALVERHGQTVLQVCRNVLGDCHLAADSFQVTFLILARRADSIRDPAALECWLHRVARRVAIRARAAVDRRKLGNFGEPADIPVNHRDPLEHDEIRAIVRQEIDRLDDALRQPIVLCALEGLTHEEAARRLRWPVGTVKSRLVRGRRRLKARLARRGLAPAAVLAFAARAQAAALVMAPRALAVATTRVVFGGATRSSAFTNWAAWLLRQELMAMSSAKFMVAALSLVGVAAVMLIGVGMAGSLGKRQPPLEARSLSLKELAAKSTTSSEPPQEKDDHEKVGAAVRLSARGRVIDAGGRPLAGASVFIREWAILRTMGTSMIESEKRMRGQEIADILARTTTDNDGRFRIQNVVAPPFPHAAVAGKGYYPWDLVAIAPGHGLAWTRLTNAQQRMETTLTVPAEGILRGRLVETDGKPVAAARIKVFGVYPLGYLDSRQHDDPAHMDLTWSSIPLLAMSGGTARSPSAGFRARCRLAWS